MTHMVNCEPYHMELRKEHVVEIYSAFLYWALRANSEMERVFKQHQDLWAWYNKFKLKNREIVDWVNSNLPCDYRDDVIEFNDKLVKKYEGK
jgi:hypothetical protein